MKLLTSLLLLLCVANSLIAQKKDSTVDAKQFFVDEKPIDVTITTDLGTLLSAKTSTTDYKAVFSYKSADSLLISEEITMTKRGHFRRANCYVPPLKLNFKTAGSPKLSSLKSLKLINGCNLGNYNDQLILKEYLVYKIYNLYTEKSFRVRLVNMKFEDSKGKKKAINMHSFFLEDIDAVAKRNKSKKLDEYLKINTENCNRAQTTLLCIFEYMIGNTDWAIPVSHNVRLISPKEDSLSKPFPVPYDFDYSGLVNANYAVPDEKLGTKSVLERVYRGYPRNMEEVKIVADFFKSKKEAVYSLIKNFDLLSSSNKNEMLGYLDDFYSDIKSDSQLKQVFILNARTE